MKTMKMEEKWEKFVFLAENLSQVLKVVKPKPWNFTKPSKFNHTKETKPCVYHLCHQPKPHCTCKKTPHITNHFVLRFHFLNTMMSFCWCILLFIYDKVLHRTEVFIHFDKMTVEHFWKVTFIVWLLFNLHLLICFNIFSYLFVGNLNTQYRFMSTVFVIFHVVKSTHGTRSGFTLFCRCSKCMWRKALFLSSAQSLTWCGILLWFKTAVV